MMLRVNPGNLSLKPAGNVVCLHSGGVHQYVSCL